MKTSKGPTQEEGMRSAHITSIPVIGTYHRIVTGAISTPFWYAHVSLSAHCQSTRLVSTPLNICLFVCLFLLCILALGQIMLLQQRRDLVGAPQLVVDLAILSLSHRRKLNCTYMLAGSFM